MSLLEGYEGIVLSQEQSPVVNLPQAFAGVVLTYNNGEKFIKIQSSRGVPIVGATVSVNNPVGDDFTETTDSAGVIAGIFDLSGTIQVRVTSGRVFYDYQIDGTNQFVNTTFTFPTEFI